jgi:transposase-like protein
MMPDTTHPYQVFPDLPPEAREALKKDILRHGVRIPVDKDEEGHTLDGHQREAICLEFGLVCPSRIVTGLTEEEKIDYAWKVNMVRRHVSVAQKRALAKQEREQGRTQEQIARRLGVSQATIAKWLRVMIEKDDLKPPATVTGADGKHYPTRKARRSDPPPTTPAEPPEPQTPATPVDPVPTTPQTVEEALPEAPNGEPALTARPATTRDRPLLSASQTPTAAPPSPTTDAIAALMDDLAHALEDHRRQGDLIGAMDDWDAATRTRWQARYRRLRVQLRALGVTLGVESRSRPPQPSVPRLDPVRPDGTPGAQARSDPIETHPDPVDVPDELDTETTKVLAVDVDADRKDHSMAADDALDIPPEETCHDLQEVEL